MPSRAHTYAVELSWTGNLGPGTSDYRAYSRDHAMAIPGKPDLLGSSDPAFRGDPGRHNPEELFVASIAACHMLWYLHLCADAGIVVTAYADAAAGRMVEGADGGGRFEEVVLAPHVAILAPGDIAKATELHERAHEKCYIANSLNFPVRCEPIVRWTSDLTGRIAPARRSAEKGSEG